MSLVDDLPLVRTVPPVPAFRVVHGDVSITVLPATISLSLYSGDDFWLRLEVNNEDGEPLDLSNATVHAQVRATVEAAGEPSAVFEPLISTDELGVVFLHLTWEQSRQAPASGVWDCRLVTNGDVVTTLAAGPVRMRPSVTRPVP